MAVKLLPSEFSGDADRLRRFELEARLAGSLSHPNVFGLWRRSVAGGSPEPVVRGPGASGWPSVSRDGRRLIYVSTTIQETLVAVEASTGRRARFEEARRTVAPTVAPDGSAVVFASLRENTTDLWRLPLRERPLSGAPKRLTDRAGRTVWPRYSPDGRWLVLLEESRRGDVWVLDAVEGRF